MGESYLVDGLRVGVARAADQVVVRFDLTQGGANPGRLTIAGAPLEGFTAEATADTSWWIYTRNGGNNGPGQPTADLMADLDGRRARTLAVTGVLDAAPSYIDTATNERLFLTRDLVVGLQPGASAAQVFARADVASYRPLRGTDDQFIVTTATPAGGAILAVADRLAEDARVAWAAPDAFVVMQAMNLNDPLLGQQWHLNNTGQNGSTPGADANVFGAWADGITGRGVILAVLDDGFDLDHPDLAPNIFVNSREIAGDGIDNDGNGYVDDVNGWDFWDNDNNPRPVNASDNHGTSVAGVAAGRGDNGIGVAGSAYQATILPVRIPLGVAAPASSFVQAVYYASGRNANGRGTWGGAAVLNHSYGGSSPVAGWQPAFDWSAQSGRGGLGALNFVATGNDGSATVSYPAAYASVIAIGASTDGDVRSGYSQYGPEIDFIAPSNGGIAGITTTDRTGAPGYDTTDYTNTFGGTSSATPLTSGIGALLLQANPTLTLDDVRAALRATAKKIGGVTYDANGFHIQYGYGKVDATAAVRYVASRLTIEPPQNLAENLPATSHSIGTLIFGITPNIADYRAEIDWGDGTGTATATLVPLGNGQFEIVSPPKSFQEGGTYTLTVRVIRQGVVVLTGSDTYEVDSLPLTDVFGVPIQTAEGVPFSGVVATFTDPDPDPMNASAYSVTIDWGDGVIGPGSVVALGGNRFQVVGNHVFGGGTHPITVTIEGPGNETATVDSSAVVTNSVLVLAPLTIQAVEGQTYNGPVAYFTDADPRNNPATYYKAEIDWGDGPYASADVNRPVADNSPTGVTSVLRIDVGNFNIAGLSITIDLSHGRVSDLTGILIAPDGTRITLFDKLAQAGANFANTTFSDDASRSILSGFAPFVGSYRPQQALSALEGKALSGTWQLELTDSKAGFVGRLNSWSIQATDQGQIAPASSGGFHVVGNYIFPVGQRQVRVVVSDSDVSRENINDTPTIANVANATIQPLSSRIQATEGVPFSGVVASFLDTNPQSDGSAFLAQIDWGDGTTSVGTVVPAGGGQFVVVGDHIYQSASAVMPNGAYDVQVTLSEQADGAIIDAVVGHSEAIVANAAIAVVPLVFEVPEGISSTVLVARFLDANTASVPENFEAQITWQPGVTARGVVTAVPGFPGLFEIHGDAFYMNSGAYGVEILLTDSGGQSLGILSTARVVDAPLNTAPVAVSAIEKTPLRSVVVARFLDTNPFSTNTGFRATINWGDGTSSVGTVVPDGNGGLQVLGSTTYAEPGFYTVVVTILGDGGSETPVVTRAAVGDLILPITGGLDSASDTGTSATDWVTRNRTPVFRGTAEALSIVTLYLTPAGGTRRAVGTARADAAGNWAIRSEALTDGRYGVQAMATDANGRPSSVLTTLSSTRLIIDGTSPGVVNATMDAATRTFRIRFTDAASGIPSSVLLNPALYGLGVPGRPNTLGRPTYLALDPNDPSTVLVRFNTSSLRGGSVVLSLNSAAITDAAGNALDVRYFLPFPATNPGPGQPFLAQFNLARRGTVTATQYVPPAQLNAANNYFQFLRQRALPRYLRR